MFIILPTPSGDDSPLIREMQLHDERNQDIDMHASKACGTTTELKALKEFQVSLKKSC